jgi:hypothetical protein
MAPTAAEVVSRQELRVFGVEDILANVECSSTLGLLNFVFVLVFRFIDLRESVDLRFLHLERVRSWVDDRRCRSRTRGKLSKH